MFNKNLGTCPLTNDASNSFFTNIIGRSEWHFKRDYSLLAMTRALLFKRLKPEDGVFTVKIKSSNFSTSVLDSYANDPIRIYHSMVDFDYLSQSITLCCLCSGVDANRKTFELLDDQRNGLVAKVEGYREATDLRQFVGQHNINARFYVNDETRSTIIVVEKLELRSYHFLISLMPRYIRWYLVEQPLDAEEIQLCKALTEPYSLKFERMLAEFCSRIDFRSHNIKRILGDFERKSRTRQLRDAEQRVRNTEDRVRQNMDSYVALIRQLDDEKVRLAGVKQMINEASDSSELIQFIIRSKYINPTEASDRNLSVIIHSYLDVFDPALAERMLRKPTSVMLDGYGISENNSVFRNIEKRTKFLSALFSDEPAFKIKTCAHFKLELAGEVYPSRGYRYPEEYQDMEPNPHLDRYTCLGQNTKMMRERLLAGDIVGCLMQCVASTKCLNMADTTVIHYFMDKLFHSTRKIIELPDKSSATIVEAFTWLENQERAAAQAAAAHDEAVVPEASAQQTNETEA